MLPATFLVRRINCRSFAVGAAALLLGLVLFCAVAVRADAAFFPAEAVDGPSSDIEQVGKVDLSYDGGGAVTYTKREGGRTRVFVSRMQDGAWSAPEAVDSGLSGDSSMPAVAAADGGRLAVAFANGGNVYGVIRNDAASVWSAPQVLSQNSDSSKPVGSVDIESNIKGNGYAVFSIPSGDQYDVRVALLDGGAWTPIDSVFDADATRKAGTGGGRVRVAVGGDGVGAVAWGETDTSAGIDRLYVRKVQLGRASATAEQLSVNDLDGLPAGNASNVSIAMEDDSSFAWAGFLQTFGGGSDSRTRALTRRMRGTAFDPPVGIDGGAGPGDPAVSAAIDLSGRGHGVTSAAQISSGRTFGAAIAGDKLTPVSFLNGAPSAGPIVTAPAVSDNHTGAIAWTQSAGGATTVQAKRFEDDAKKIGPELKPGTPEFTISNSAFGNVDPTRGFDAAADSYGDVAVAFVQEEPGGGRRVVVAPYDNPPVAPNPKNLTRLQKTSRPKLNWSGSKNLWGPVTYEVQIGGLTMGTTNDTNYIPIPAIFDGKQKVRIVAIDRRGQKAYSKERALWLDSQPPVSSFEITTVGRLHAKKPVRLKVKATDGLGIGIKSLSLKFGNGKSVQRKKIGSASTVYRKPGRYTISLRAVDRSGNRSDLIRQRIQIYR